MRGTFMFIEQVAHILVLEQGIEICIVDSSGEGESVYSIQSGRKLLREWFDIGRIASCQEFELMLEACNASGLPYADTDIDPNIRLGLVMAYIEDTREDLLEIFSDFEGRPVADILRDEETTETEYCSSDPVRKITRLN